MSDSNVSGMLVMQCRFSDDMLKGVRGELRKYMLENPSCKEAPEYEGYCMKHLPFKLRLQYEYEQTTKEQRQQFLDVWHSGKTLGEAYEIVGISFEAAMAIMDKAIMSYNYVSREAE